MSSRGSRGSDVKQRARAKLLKKHGHGCCFCGRMFASDALTIEHVLPLSLGGGWDLSNLRLSCSPCNTERGVEPFYDFQAKKREQVKPKIEILKGWA